MMELQIRRVRELHRIVREALQNDEFELLEPAIAELSSRIRELCKASDSTLLSTEEQASFSRLREATDQLTELVVAKLRITSTELKKARDARHAVTEYCLKPARERAHLTTGMDLLG